MSGIRGPMHIFIYLRIYVWQGCVIRTNQLVASPHHLRDTSQEAQIEITNTGLWKSKSAVNEREAVSEKPRVDSFYLLASLVSVPSPAPPATTTTTTTAPRHIDTAHITASERAMLLLWLATPRYCPAESISHSLAPPPQSIDHLHTPTPPRHAASVHSQTELVTHARRPRWRTRKKNKPSLLPAAARRYRPAATSKGRRRRLRAGSLTSSCRPSWPGPSPCPSRRAPGVGGC